MFKHRMIVIPILCIIVFSALYIIMKPSIYLMGNNHVYLQINHAYTELGATATILNKDISKNIIVSGEVDTTKLGTYKLTYTIKSNNIVSRVTRYVTILENLPERNSTIYITFDDGPSNITSKLLDVLKEENVKATFFILNWDDKYDTVIKRMANEGHTIGLHGYIHKYRKNYKSVDAYFNDLLLIHDKVYATTGVDSRIIRFIGGSSNTISRFNRGIMTKLTKEVIKKGYFYFDWNIDSKDTKRISSNRVYKNVINKLKDKETYIVLMHDYDNNKKTVTALKKIIEYGKENGYIFGNITEYTKPTNHKVRN